MFQKPKLLRFDFLFFGLCDLMSFSKFPKFLICKLAYYVCSHCLKAHYLVIVQMIQHKRAHCGSDFRITAAAAAGIVYLDA